MRHSASKHTVSLVLLYATRGPTNSRILSIFVLNPENNESHPVSVRKCLDQAAICHKYVSIGATT